MPRRKVKLELIADDTARKTSFKKRTPSLMKKMKEIQTLCGIEACVIMKSPYEPEKLDLWPDREGVQKVVGKYRAMPEIDQNKKTYNMEEYVKKRIGQVKDQFEKQVKDNRANYIAEVKSECMGDRGLLAKLNLEELNDVIALGKVKLPKIDAMLKLRESGVPPRKSPPPPPPSPPGSSEGGNESEPVTESSEDSDDDEEDEVSDEEEDEASDSDEEEDYEEDEEEDEPLAEDHGGLDGGVAVGGNAPVAENIPDGGLTVEDSEPVAQNPDGGVVAGGGGDVPAGKESPGDLDITSTTEWIDEWFDNLEEPANDPNRSGSGPSSPKTK